MTGESTPRNDTTTTEYLSYGSLRLPLVVRTVGAGYQYDQDTNEQYTRYEYSNRGQVKKEIAIVTLKNNQPAEEITNTYEYDGSGDLVLVRYPDDSQVIRTYDWMHRVTEEMFVPAGQTSTSALVRKTTVVYNDSERSVTEILPSLEEVKTTYSPFGLELKKTRKVGKQTRTMVINESLDGEHVDRTLAFGNQQFQTTQVIDTIGRPKETTNSVGEKTSYRYNNMGQVNGLTYLMDTIRVDQPNGLTQKTSYDQFGRVSKEEYTASNPSKSRTVTYAYDNMNRVSSKTEEYTDLTAANGKKSETTYYSYDGQGRLIRLLDAIGQTHTYRYNRFGDVLSYQINGNEQKRYAYNQLGWLMKESTTDQQVDQYGYKKTGHLEEFVDRNQQKTTYQYTSYYEPSVISVSQENTEVYRQEYDYEPTRRLLKQLKNTEKSRLVNDQVVESIDYKYDQWGRMNQQIIANRNYVMAYDGFDRLVKLTYPATATSTASQVNYTYDLLNRIQTVQETDLGTVNYTYSINDPLANQAAEKNEYKITYSKPALPSQRFLADPFGDLKTVSHGSSNPYHEIQETNGIRNIIQRTATNVLPNSQIQTITEGFTYDGLGRLTTESKTTVGQSASSSESATYAYDERGNRDTLSRTPMGQNTSARQYYSYNALNQLKSVSTVEGTSSKQAVFSYYGDGLRATKTVDGQKTRYVYLNGHVIDELDAKGNVKARNIWGNELLYRKAMTGSGTNFEAGYYYYNGHSDVIAIRASTGSLMKQYAYDSWGRVTETFSTSTTFNNPFLYTGEVYDSETGLYYLRARYYDPREGRFINEDTYNGQFDNPLSLNIYTYVHNNPLIFTDPSGFVAESQETFNVNLKLNSYKESWNNANNLRNKTMIGSEQYIKYTNDLLSFSQKAAILRQKNKHLTGLIKSSDPMQIVVKNLPYSEFCICKNPKVRNLVVRIDPRDNTVYYPLPNKTFAYGEQVHVKSNIEYYHGETIMGGIDYFLDIFPFVGWRKFATTVFSQITGNTEITPANTKRTIAFVKDDYALYNAVFVVHDRVLIDYQGWSSTQLLDPRTPWRWYE